jgi:hypothetical protein
MSASASAAFEGRFMDQELYRQQAHRGRAIWRIVGNPLTRKLLLALADTSRASRPAERPVPLPAP